MCGCQDKRLKLMPLVSSRRLSLLLRICCCKRRNCGNPPHQTRAAAFHTCCCLCCPFVPAAPHVSLAHRPACSGFLKHFSDLDDTTKYAGIDFFMQFNQPPTNDTFCRAARFDNFFLHTGSPWERVEEEGGQVGAGWQRGD